MFAVRHDVTDARLAELGADGLGGAHTRGWSAPSPDRGDGSTASMRYSSPAAPGGGGAVDRADLDDHPRVRLARRLRHDVRVLGLPDPARRAVVTLGRGIAGLTELSFELEPEQRGRGAAAALIEAALAAVPTGELVVSAVAPGNAASLRALLSAGFSPLGSIQLFTRSGTLGG